MKSIIITAVALLFALFVKAQSVNEQLYKAVGSKDTLQVEKLLNDGADASYIKKLGQAEVSILIWAVMQKNLKSVKLLVDHKANINWKDWFKTTALMYAADLGNLDIINYLVKNGADIHAHDDQGNNVLSAAKEGKHSEAIKLIENLLQNK
jgi:ankyrin repeat protein